MKFIRNTYCFILAFVLLVSNSGILLDAHYCGKTLVGISLKNTLAYNQPSASCCSLKSIKKASCCHNKVVHLHKKNDYSETKTFGIPFQVYFVASEIILHQFSKNSIQNFKPLQSTFYCEAHAPPFYKLYHQLLFYA